MSATGRGAVRAAADFYPTPAWCVRRLLEAVRLPGGRWREPAAGDGAIIRAVNAVRSDVRWHAVELRAECRAELETTGAEVTIGDFRALDLDPVGVIVMNPPFTLALEFVRRAVELAPVVCMLERLNWLASEERATWLRSRTPSVYVLPNRPSFTGGSTDATDYAWLVWGLGGAQARVVILPATPAAERVADPRQLALPLGARS